MEDAMTIEEIYEMMKEKQRSMYLNEDSKVEFTQAEFFHLYHMLCFMKQIKYITDGLS